ncbi:MAG: lytic transglycosylase domain-containing protein [Candidatus Solibacter sp.]
MTLFLWILFAGAALAQTAALPASPDGPAAAAQTADKTAPAAAKPPETFQSAMAKQRAAVAAQRAAIATQRAAVRQQMQTAVEWQLTTPGGEGPAADCDPIADPELAPLIDSAAKQHQVEPKVLRGMIEQESGFRPCAISPKGAKGLMQLMPATIEQFKVDDVFDPQQNIEAGATYLQQLLEKYKGDLKLALAAYNAGPGSVDKTGGIPDIKETQDYVEGVMKKTK